ncbi:hypothetical protein SAMN04490220_0020 [Rhodococcus jostii]|uniref:Uncharacterized protein n=1 Tax=Rhodococcus jostii TaxID=132919 RepID=A0A1H4II21_RHOJO|nr:hypothetical protein SAMN04490220_0020 [Rhodococcus jostii]
MRRPSRNPHPWCCPSRPNQTTPRQNQGTSNLKPPNRSLKRQSRSSHPAESPKHATTAAPHRYGPLLLRSIYPRRCTQHCANSRSRNGSATARPRDRTAKWSSMQLRGTLANFNAVGAQKNLNQALGSSSGGRPVHNRAADGTAKSRLVYPLPGSLPPIPQHSMRLPKSGRRVAAARWSSTHSACISVSGLTETDNRTGARTSIIESGEVVGGEDGPGGDPCPDMVTR